MEQLVTQENKYWIPKCAKTDGEFAVCLSEGFNSEWCGNCQRTLR